MIYDEDNMWTMMVIWWWWRWWRRRRWWHTIAVDIRRRCFERWLQLCIDDKGGPNSAIRGLDYSGWTTVSAPESSFHDNAPKPLLQFALRSGAVLGDGSSGRQEQMTRRHHIYGLYDHGNHVGMAIMAMESWPRCHVYRSHGQVCKYIGNM